MMKVDYIEKCYGSKIVLKGVSFELKQGQIYGLVGENGAGKTTLFECLNNLTPYQGLVTLSDKNLQIGYLPTSLYFYPNMKGVEYLDFCQSARKLKPNKELVDSLNNILNLPLNDYAVSYSTGMKKKLALMALLTQRNDVLLLDEPFNGLDLSSCLILKHLLVGLVEKQNKTILLSSHIISSLTDISEQIFHLSDGIIKRTYNKNDFGAIEEEITHLLLDDKLDSINKLLD